MCNLRQNTACTVLHKSRQDIQLYEIGARQVEARVKAHRVFGFGPSAADVHGYAGCVFEEFKGLRPIGFRSTSQRRTSIWLCRVLVAPHALGRAKTKKTTDHRSGVKAQGYVHRARKRCLGN